MENLLPVKDGVSITRYHKAHDINMSATRTGFEEFAGRKFTDEQFKDLILLCKNATEKGLTQFGHSPNLPRTDTLLFQSMET